MLFQKKNIYCLTNIVNKNKILDSKTIKKIIKNIEYGKDDIKTEKEYNTDILLYKYIKQCKI
tara:strand:- start:19193 stop:19378 length:186 start_codon:yes stop_codon:yes gene_type:complete